MPLFSKRLKQFVKALVFGWLLFSDVASSVEPKPLESTDWYQVFSEAYSNLFSEQNSEAKPTTSEDQIMQTTNEKLKGFFENIIGKENMNNVDTEAARWLNSFQEGLPDLSSLGIDPSNMPEWNWDAFITKMLPPTNETDTITTTNKDDEEIPPECKMTTPEMIRHAGYPCEEHTVETEDGYILTMHRIPHGVSDIGRKGRGRFRQKRSVVFMQHGLLADSSCWVANGPGERSLSYVLADLGCDVWLGNVRGSTYSRAHTTLNADTSEKYWRFSWQHMSEHDIPSMVDKALQVSGHNNLYYIGHSQGTLVAFARLAENTEFNQKIKMLFALGPVTSLANLTSPIKSLVYLNRPAFLGMSMFGGTEVLPKKALSQWISAKLHKMQKEQTSDSLGNQIAYQGNNLMMYLCGVHLEHYYKDRLPVYLSHTPGGTSLQNLLHLSQMIESGKMQKWDYWSVKENLDAYGQETPPEYDVCKIKTPIALFVGHLDQLAHPDDNRLLSQKLNSLFYYKVLDDWDHLDFLWGKNAGFIYKKISAIISENEGVTHNVDEL
uniref:lysosomal acid lipase/cholesteryl ester hydrolase isoform X1 n=1 Tax=Ciona intestinalis TaxID=7719 RepID=UPI0005211D8E|nr:lysosomal acid lipase/cholesteryl ester hydrolase isoform X1 [Ciona intestinalis]|eukprot:XP_026696310.1 lysosomal acid lipase/cholesteryl ester hydrolase isoform X1 [Ciona intestinalis]